MRGNYAHCLVYPCHPVCLNDGESAIASELPEKCRQVPDKGSCKAMIEKFYFNQKANICSSYYYDGCGKVVPFDTLEACQKLCEQSDAPPEKKGGVRHDPIENDPKYADVFKIVDAEVDQMLSKESRRGRGFIHIIWETKKWHLKRKYNIDWLTPAEMNPHIMFD